jgi:hypothetical protein
VRTGRPVTAPVTHTSHRAAANSAAMFCSTFSVEAESSEISASEFCTRRANVTAPTLKFGGAETRQELDCTYFWPSQVSMKQAQLVRVRLDNFELDLRTGELRSGDVTTLLRERPLQIQSCAVARLCLWFPTCAFAY